MAAQLARLGTCTIVASSDSPHGWAQAFTPGYPGLTLPCMKVHPTPLGFHVGLDPTMDLGS